VFAVAGAVINAANLVGFLLGGVLVEVVAPGRLISAAGLAGLVVTASLAAPVWRAAVRERHQATPAPGDPARGEPAQGDPAHERLPAGQAA
jgi:hypothetical protein